MAFPTTPILDDFNAGANQGLSTRAGWANGVRALGFSDFTTDAVPTKAVAPGGGGDNVWGTQFTDCEAYFQIADWPGSGGSWQVFARYTTAATKNGYRVSHFSGTILLQQMTGGASTNLGSGSLTLAAGDWMGIECIGTTISGYTKIGAGAWTQFATASDATYAGPGNIAMTTDTPGNNVAAFGGGAIVVAASPFAPRRSSVRRA